MTTPQQLMTRLCTEARNRGFEVRENPDAFTRDRMRARAVSSAVEGDSPDIKAPPVVLGFLTRATFGTGEMSRQYAVMIGSFEGVEESDEAVGELWSRYHAQAAITRSWLIGDNLDDLCLIFVGPEGSEDNSFWIAQAGEIERNDLVCRKLVWLPPAQDLDEMERALAEMVARTFLARPWEVGARNIQNSLDSLTSGLSALPDLGVAPEVIRTWLAYLEEAANGSVVSDDLVMRLIKAVP